MRILLDTNVFLYLIMDDPNLSQKSKDVFLDEGSEPFLSMASVWEMFIKTSTGKLSLPEKPSAFIREQLAINGISLLPIRYTHLEGLLVLPMIHKDPFDRVIIAQSLSEKMPVLSSNPVFAEYGVENLF
jgi:PIN domain nuclease of toxin-antitoxin system